MIQPLLILFLASQVLTLLSLDLNLNVSKNEFSRFSSNNGKRYLSHEESKYRQIIFNKNVELIQLMNSASSSVQMGLTFYSDYSSEEFASLVLNPRIATTPEAIKEFKSLLSGLAGVTDSLINTVTGLTGVVGGLVGIIPVIKPVNGLLNGVGAGLGGLLRGLGGGSAKSTTTAKASSTAKTSALSPSKNTKVAATTTIQPTVDAPEYRFAPSKDIKPSVDWRSSKRVSEVKMQGACGNCYAFSATGALESAYMIKHNTSNVSYSDQQLTDCCGASGFGCNGCNGGWQWQAFQYIKANGVVTQGEYPTTSSEQGEVGKCQKLLSPFKIINDKTPFKAIPQGNVTALYEAVSKQPVSVGVDSANMQFVISKNLNQLFTNCSSSFDDANHAMLVVGYDSSGNWILKNSWSNNWGNNGYIKLKAGNTCGIANYALYPIVN